LGVAGARVDRHEQRGPQPNRDHVRRQQVILH
jgi:hypothetical protein